MSGEAGISLFGMKSRVQRARAALQAQLHDFQPRSGSCACGATSSEDEHTATAPSAYPEIHHATSPLRNAARESGDSEAVKCRTPASPDRAATALVVPRVPTVPAGPHEITDTASTVIWSVLES